MLCRKAGAPTADVRGNIISHRARSTIASQLYNAKEPMTLFELQEWLGHRTPDATTHYAKLTQNTLARAYNDAGFFARNVRTVEVLVERDAVASGAAASGEPWQNCWRRKTTCRRCRPISRSPTMNAPPSTTGRPSSTSSSNDSPTLLPPQGRHRARSVPPATATLLPVIDLTTRTRSCRPGEPC
ncbi:hypothetical protein ABT404_49205 [Streptomyces hyaluromycini]|uniref:Tyr recombinase domain-containing protein n=1 Tax=Streptomyces hyaluromycini TaxID=1377993 RepID=A0ABV1XEH0_9ACTN